MGAPTGLKMSVQFQNVNGMTIKMLVTLQAMSTLLHAEKFENATITGYFEFAFEKNSSGEMK